MQAIRAFGYLDLTCWRKDRYPSRNCCCVGSPNAKSFVPRLIVTTSACHLLKFHCHGQLPSHPAQYSRQGYSIGMTVPAVTKSKIDTPDLAIASAMVGDRCRINDAGWNGHLVSSRDGIANGLESNHAVVCIRICCLKQLSTTFEVDARYNGIAVGSFVVTAASDDVFFHRKAVTSWKLLATSICASSPSSTAQV